MAPSSLSGFIQYVGVYNLLTGVMLCLLISWVLRSNRKSYYNLPPGPPAIPYPFDALMALFPQKNVFWRLVQITRRYGELACVRTGRNTLFIVGSPSLVKEIFVKQAEVTSGRKTPDVYALIQYKGGIVFNQGKSWQDVRRFSLLALRNFGMGKRNIEERIIQETRILDQSLVDLGGRPFDPATILNLAVTNIICGITFGRRFEYDDPLINDLINRLRKLTSGAGSVGFLRELTKRFPILYQTPLLRYLRDNVGGLKNFFNKEIREHRATYDPADIRDIIDMYITEVRREKSPEEQSSLSYDDMWACVWDLFVAGTETTSNSLAWLLLYLTKHPDIEKKIADEIESVVGRERAPSTTDRKDMPFTDATLLEILRIRPILPVGVPHRTERAIEVNGYTIPNNSEIVINIMAIHHDPKLWDKPEEFNPRRFLNKDGTAVIKSDVHTVFGAGRRICLGEQLARMEFFLFATALIQRFKFRLQDGIEADFTYDHCVGTFAPKPYKLIAQVR